MKFSSHAKAGLIASTIIGFGNVVLTNDIKLSVMAAALAFIGSIFPDLDTESIPSRWAARIGFGFSLLCLYFKKPQPAAILGALFFLIKSGSHRGFTHKYSLPALGLAMWFYSGNFLYTAFSAGLVVHFWLDKINPLEGKNWF